MALGGSSHTNPTNGLPFSGFFVPRLDLNFVLRQATSSCSSESTESDSGIRSTSSATCPTRNAGQRQPGTEDFSSHTRRKVVVVAQRQQQQQQQQHNKPFRCPQCPRGFTVKGNMTRHLKYECGQQPRFQCPYCEFRSKQTSNVMSHIRSRHVGEQVHVVRLKYDD
jgi:uncharacterized Zn-finger protein